MSNTSKLFGQNALFLVWGPPAYGPRSRALSQNLGISDINYLYNTRRRGFVSALVKYPYQAVHTLLLLFRKRPLIVLVQSPPSVAIFFVWLYCQATGARYMVDAHSAAFQEAVWLRPLFLYRYLARRALATIVTNQQFGNIIQSWGARALVLRDIPTEYPSNGKYPLTGDYNVAVVNTFSSDEPIEAVLNAAKDVPDVHFYITGDIKRAPRKLLASTPANVHFTDFLPDEIYYTLLHSVQAVMCLTTRDRTMQRGACEALSIGKPIITSNWPILRDYFRFGAVHVSNTPASICQGVLKVKNHYVSYSREIRKLQILQQDEWRQKKHLLISLALRQS